MNPSWQKLERAIATLHALIHSRLDFATFQSQFLAETGQAIDATRVYYWSREDIARGQPGGVWERDAKSRADFNSRAVAVVVDNNRSLIREGSDDSLIFSEPIPGDGSPMGALEIHLPRAVSLAWADLGPAFFKAAAELAAEEFRNRLLLTCQNELSRHENLIRFIRQIQDTQSLGELAHVMATELRQFFDCERVIVAGYGAGKSRILAVSGVVAFNPDSAGLRAWRQLGDFAAPGGEVLWSGDPSREIPEMLEAAVVEVRETGRVIDYALLPLTTSLGDHTVTVGWIACEWFTRAAQRPIPEWAKLPLALTAPIFLRESLRAANPLTAWSEQWTKRQWLTTETSLSIKWIVSSAIIGALLLLSLLPVPFAIEATGELMPDRQAHVFAPADGVVCELTGNDGRLDEQEILMRLDNRPWALELATVHGQLAEVEQDLRATETERLRTADGPEAMRDVTSLAARIEHLNVKHRELKTLFELLQLRAAELEIRAPLAGEVITWEWKRELAGRPVKRGERLCTVADLQGSWHVAIHVPDDQAWYVSEAQQQGKKSLAVQLRFSNAPGIMHEGILTKLAPALATQSGERSTLACDVTEIQPQIQHARPGMTATVKIHCGTRTLAFVWLRPVWEWWREHYG